MINYFDKIHLGKEFGSFSVVEIQESDFSGEAIWELKCGKCSNVFGVMAREIMGGNLIKCICGNSYKNEGDPEVLKSNIQLIKIDSTSDNLEDYQVTSQDRQKLRKVRQVIIDRCYKKNNTSYHLYGGIGVCVSNDWLESIDNFINWSISNGYRPWLKLKRKNKEGNYTNDNCYWGEVDSGESVKVDNEYLATLETIGVDTAKMISELNKYTIDVETIKEGANRILGITGGQIDSQNSLKILKKIAKELVNSKEKVVEALQVMEVYQLLRDKQEVKDINGIVTGLNSVNYALNKLIYKLLKE